MFVHVYSRSIMKSFTENTIPLLIGVPVTAT